MRKLTIISIAVTISLSTMVNANDFANDPFAELDQEIEQLENEGSIDEQKEFNQWKDDYLAEYQQFRKVHFKKLDDIRDKLINTWGSAEVSTVSKFVNYSDQQDVKTVIDYSKNEIRISVIHDADESVSEQKLVESLTSTAKKIDNETESEHLQAELSKDPGKLISGKAEVAQYTPTHIDIEKTFDHERILIEEQSIAQEQQIEKLYDLMHVSKNQSSTDSVVEDEVIKQAAAKAAIAKEAATKEAAAKAEIAKEAAAKEAAVKAEIAKETAAKEAIAKEAAAKEAIAKEAKAKEDAAREAIAKESAVREAAAKEAIAKETAAKEAAAQNAIAKAAEAKYIEAEKAIAAQKQKILKEKQQRLIELAKTKQKSEKTHLRDDLKTKKITTYTIPLRSKTEFKRAQPFIVNVKQESQRWELSPSLMLAIMHTESYFNPKAQSHIPAYGLMQIVPRTASIDVNRFLYKKDEAMTQKTLFQPGSNIETGGAYIHILNSKYLKNITNDESRTYCVIAAYNTGSGNVAKTFNADKSRNVRKAAKVINKLSPQQVYDTLVGSLPYEETRNYLKKVTKRRALYLELDKI
ncbi:transglycosylase SLT domain-containing protein [Thalassotalea sp. ND16A]|uniref:transglycosylase SLT domain-containing protein n=1 Tax=Thalassotalea sp. ND16A TaxID=1535422 RepID=UPI00051CDE1D|nr:transglycosylase SLT domain-containing protein [Thalassotalea sp. ND16A]KGJ99064.1 hypothetical protein ND16A_0395 [Thalassotalea sp. ND16A]